MIRIAICSTDNTELNQLRNTVCNYAEEHTKWNISISSYSTSKHISAAINKECFHIYLIDILLDDKNGIELGEEIRQTDQHAIIIYMASTPNLAVRSYTVQAFYFLLKPFKAEDLSLIFECACVQAERTISKNTIAKTRDVLSGFLLRSEEQMTVARRYADARRRYLDFLQQRNSKPLYLNGCSS